MTVTTREAFERGTQTFNAHDLDGFAQVLTDDVTFSAPGEIRGQGKAACVRFFGTWLNAFPDGQANVHHVDFLDEIAIEQGTFTGTHTNALYTPTGDIPPTGRPVSVDYIQLLRFREGKHIAFNLMFDRLQLLQQLGAIPAPPPAASAAEPSQLA
jgi:ketosteroid isomerase-like protein